MNSRLTRIAWLIVVGVIALRHTAIAAELPVVDDPVAYVLAEAKAEGDPENSLIKVSRDFNNDGLEDLSLARASSCGNKTCSFELFLKRPDGRYVRVGDLGGLPFGFRVVPLRPGTARVETCSASGTEVRFGSSVVSMKGISDGEGRILAPKEIDDLCKWTGVYTWEECAVKEFRRNGTCKWKRKSWRGGP